MANKRTLHKLSPGFVSKHTEPGFYSDGGNLYLQIDDAGAKRWIFRYMRNGKQRDHGLGGTNLVSLKMARDRAEECRRLLGRGLDPIGERKAALKKVPSFGEAADEFFAAHLSEWSDRHAKQMAVDHGNAGRFSPQSGD